MKKIALILFLVCGLSCFTLAAMAQDEDVAATTGAGDEETDIIAGKVAAVDVANNALTVTDEAGKSYTVTATKEETSIWKGDDTINLADVKTGESVELEYYKDKASGKLMAIWVDVLLKEAAAPAEATPAAPAEATTQPAAPEAATQPVQ
ncbi:MAG: hypothetical protein NTV07_06705 [Candidatus Omnitrophica bacterium]|nr:hypothetical protein [Candidatus Omnitrophota bacterium]